MAFWHFGKLASATATRKRGKYFSAISQASALPLRKSSISRRSSNDISASVVSEDHKEEEHKEEEHFPEDVGATAVTAGHGAEEDIDVENGSSSVRVVRSILSTSIVEEGSIHDVDEDDKKVQSDDGDNLAVSQ